MEFSEKLRMLYTVIVLFVGFIIFAHLPRKRVNLRKIALFWNKSSLLSLDNPAVNSMNNKVTVMPRSKIVAQKVPNDDPYSAILHVDKVTPFLDPEARRFLHNSRNFTFPSKYKKMFVDTLVEFDRIWRQKLNRTYILYGGTLLGAYRHGQTIPWDDDLDVLVDLKYNKTINEDFKGTKFAVLDRFNLGIAIMRKLFFTHRGIKQNKYGSWPNINLVFFQREQNGSRLRIEGQNFVLLTDYVFPVTQIPFEGHVFSGPRCPEQVTQIVIGETALHQCCARFHDGRLQKFRKIFCISCSKLHGLFRFITWRRINDTHSQQMISEPPEINKMAAVYKSKKEKWRKGPVIFMPES